MANWRARLAELLCRGILWGDRRVRPGVRTLIGIPVMVGGVFGILPILGFWMIPLGGALIALDIPPIRHRLVAWAERHRRRGGGGLPGPPAS